jgi:5-hydroxyisourate hydrolase
MITTHVLDLSTGRPASGVRVSLARVEQGKRVEIGAGVTDGDGRLKDLMRDDGKTSPATFELTFETGAYFEKRGVECFHPRVTVTFDVTNAAQHMHVPLLISPFGYSTYRGS